MNNDSWTISRRDLLKAGALTAVSATMIQEGTPVQAQSRTSTSNPQRTRNTLMDYIGSLEIIDAHEHLAPEPDRVGMPVDALTLVGMYNYVDLQNAGMPRIDGEGLWARNYMIDASVPLEERWARVWPWLQQVKYGGYYRAAKLAMKRFYNIDDLNPRTYRELTERMRAYNTPGLYKRVLRDACRIRTCLVQNGRVEGQQPADLLTPVQGDTAGAPMFWNLDYAKAISAMHKMPIDTLDDYLAVLAVHMQDSVKRGAVGFKLGATPMVAPDRNAARTEYLEVLKGARAGIQLHSVVWDFVCATAGRLGKTVAVHTGVWGDYRTNDPKLIMDAVMRHPQTRFDIYHLGFPSTRDVIFIVKNNPNAWANLCWSWIVSPTITREAVNELLDLVPVNKVTAFGADYSFNVECVYGHLQMAREGLAEAFTDRIARGWLGLDDARHILKMWLFDNPASLYGLSL